MSDQINRTILNNFDVNHIVDSSHHDINKSGSNNVMKNIENNAMQFVVSNRTEEFIDHSLLNPEYISTDISGNNFIIGLMSNSDGGNISTNEHYHSGNIIGESITSNDIHYTNSGNYDLEHERRLNATILQLVKNGSLRVDGDTTQLIITNNKHFTGLHDSVKTSSNIEDSAHFLTIEDSHNLAQLNEGQLKIFHSQHIPQQQLVPLPELTPIRTLNNSKSVLNLNVDNSAIDEGNISQVQNVKAVNIEENRYQIQLEQQEHLEHIQQPKHVIAKKVLPHKKRYALTKKLKTSIETNLPPSPQTALIPQTETRVESNHLTQHIYHDDQVILNEHENLQLSTQFSCQICAAAFHCQLEFFSHLKVHYEPIKEENATAISISNSLSTSIPIKQLAETVTDKKMEPIYSTPDMHTVNDLSELQFTNYSNVSSSPFIISSVRSTTDKMDQTHNAHRKPKKYFKKFDNQTKLFNDLPIASKFDDLSNNVLSIHNEKPVEDISATIDNSCENSQSPISQNLLNLTSEFTKSSTILPQLTPSKHLILPHLDETEFSDPEDMLEGIRSVVDKVQESDNEDLEIQSPKSNWYTSGALNGSVMPRLRSASNGPVIDLFQIYFKNEDEVLKQHVHNSEHILQMPNSDQQNADTIITVTEIPNSQDTDFQTLIENHHFDSTVSNHDMSIKSEKIISSDDDSTFKNENRKSFPSESINVNKEINGDNRLNSDNLKQLSNKHTKTKTKKSKLTSVKSDNAAAKPIASTNNSIPFSTIIPFASNVTWEAEESNSLKIENISELCEEGIVKKRRGRPPKIKSVLKNSDLRQPLVLIKKDSIFQSNIKLENSSALLNPSNDVQLRNILDSDIFSKPVQDESPNTINEILNNSIFDDTGNSDFNSDDDVNESDEFNTRFKTPKKKHICEKCNKIFNSINALKYHDFSHTGLRPHKCGECDKAFFALNALKTHQRVHTGDKPFKCEECNRAFRQWGDLTYHKISLHSNKKDYQCEFCGKSFARKYSLVIHRRIHTGERNYSCEFCSKSFRASSYLQNHRKIHTGEKPYHCGTCGKKFRVCGDLKRHTKIHEREQKLNKHLDNIIESEYKLKPDNNDVIKSTKGLKKVSV